MIGIKPHKYLVLLQQLFETESRYHILRIIETMFTLRTENVDLFRPVNLVYLFVVRW